MREFFRGWKRKVGCVTLALACLALAGWVSGQRVLHTILPMGKIAFQVVSRKGTLTFRKITSRYTIMAKHGDADMVLLDITPSEKEIPPREWRFPTDTEFYGDSRSWQLWGFCLSHTDIVKVPDIPDAPDIHRHSPSLHWFQVSAYTIPYWSVTIPLTVISAFLLLSKPKTSTPKKIPEPTANEGA